MSSHLPVTFTRHHPKAEAPRRAHQGDAGYDIAVCEAYHLIRDGWVEMKTGIKVQPPQHVWFRLVGRSSSRVRGLIVHEGTIDSGYRGELVIVARNITSDTIHIEPGERLAQLIPQFVIDLDWSETSMLEQTMRGENGFGSTGR